MDDLIHKYKSQKRNARRRGIEFLLTFEEWLAIWRASGKLSKRGCGKGQYVMGRRIDRGPYAIGNVEIVSALKNMQSGYRTDRKRPKRKRSKSALSAKVREARLRAGETQAEFCKRFGVSRFTYIKWERYGIPKKGPARVAIENVLGEL